MVFHNVFVTFVGLNNSNYAEYRIWIGLRPIHPSTRKCQYRSNTDPEYRIGTPLVQIEASPCPRQRHWFAANPLACACLNQWTGSQAGILDHIVSSPLGWWASIALHKESEEKKSCKTGPQTFRRRHREFSLLKTNKGSIKNNVLILHTFLFLIN